MFKFIIIGAGVVSFSAICGIAWVAVKRKVAGKRKLDSGYDLLETVEVMRSTKGDTDRNYRPYRSHLPRGRAASIRRR